jgi:hypothetical protein
VDYPHAPVAPLRPSSPPGDTLQRMRPLRCAPVALWLVLLASTAASAAPEQVTYALIIANNTGLEPKQAPLRSADDDGALYYELFAPRTREAVLLSVLDAETQALHPGLAARTRPPPAPRSRRHSAS